ncbi:hypothetical protein E4T49_00622 [Aureobasidium sp. EXF-10728]|nr:hypothetical protein E4T49_00622 [Aureobasidium sp. EXF-10728]
MSDHNTYLTCKKQTSQKNDVEAAVNTTGQVTTKELVNMARLVASRLSQQQIPSTIFRLLHSVISARSSAHAAFVQMTSNYEDNEMKKSNETHKYFIDRLTEAFQVLGGSKWASKRATELDEPHSNEEIEEFIFSNVFSALELHQCADDVSDDEADSETLPATKHSHRTSKAKRNHRSKQKKTQRKRTANSQAVLDVPLENYCLVDGPESVLADYRMALVSVFVEWWKLREHVQIRWLNVAYEDFNSAIAGAVSEMAITMIRKTALAVFVEFPSGFDTYQAMTRDFNHDDLEDLFLSNPEIGEAFSMHIYQDLLDFLIDYQKNRTGKPTKRMQAKLSDWDPYFNLQQANMQERIAWRRSYTINWLYDLVNVFSHIVIQENKITTERQAYETIEWSVKTPYHRSRKLFGMERFAEVITTLAMQQPGSDVQSQIFPHHVFQLQCVIDSFTASRGWAPGMQRQYGHFTKATPGKASPTECLELFLGNQDSGFLSGAAALSSRLKEYQSSSGDKLACFRITWMLLDRLSVQLKDWLGKSAGAFANEVSSRFSKHSQNGLWEYNPFLCGVGLVEALEISYRLSMLCWDTSTEVLAMLRLQELLVQKGYMTQFDELLSFLTINCAPHGPHPSDLSSRARTELESRGFSRVAKYKHRDPEMVIGVCLDMKDALSVDGNFIFRRKSQLLVYHESDWDTARLVENRESDFSLLKSLATVWDRDKLGEDSKDDLILRLYRENATRFNNAFAGASSTPESSEIAASAQRLGHSEYGPNGLGQLVLAEWDIVNDVCSKIPLSAIDYTWVTMKFMTIFDAVEKRLTESRNPLYLQCIHLRKRMNYLEALIQQGLSGHEECLTVLAAEMEKHPMSVEKSLYWGRRDNRFPGFPGSGTPWYIATVDIEGHKEQIAEQEDHDEGEEERQTRIL